jgi:hypothetical protein
MNKLFPESAIIHRKIALDGTPLSEGWTAPKINLKAKAVCKDCNTGWMSRLENDSAKPAMADLILGNRIGELSKRRARGLSLFAFKTAVIANRSLPESEWFFERSDRYAFRQSLAIPPNVAMFLVGMADSSHGVIFSHNVSYTDLSLNVCSFCVGHWGFQVVSGKGIITGARNFQSIPTPPDLVARFYPALDQVSWPRKKVLGIQAFNDFGARWNYIKSL